MKKVFAILLLPFILGLSGCSHNIIKWKQWNLRYESPEKIRKYRTESNAVLGYDNYNLAVDIEVVPLYEETDEFRADIKYAAKELALGLSFEKIKTGDFIPKVEKGFYVIGHDIDDDGEEHPAIIAVIINEYRNVAFEITIDCYNKNLEKGLAIVKSFEFY